jgi:thiamine-phosphate pyrophosphorylase
MIPDPPLFVVTDRRQAVLPLGDILEAAFGAGCRWASLREKDLPQDEQFALLRTLLPIARKWRARLTVHGEVAAAGAAGLHLAAGSDPTAARTSLPPDALVGISIHSAAEARTLDPVLVDYAIAGPTFETASKPGYGPALGTEGLRAIVQAARVPIIAIGGIEPARVAEVLRAGAAGIAVMGSVMRSHDPAGEVRALLAEVQRARYGGTP